MKTYNTILTEKQQKYLTGEEILPSDQSRIIRPAKCAYSPLRKAFEKQIKTFKYQGIKQVEALKTLKLEKIRDQNQQKKLFLKSLVLIKLKMK